MQFDINAINATAAEIVGLDCALPLDAATLHAVKQAFLTHPVLIFRNQHLSAEELAAFCSRFGRLEDYAHAAAAAGDAEERSPSRLPALSETGARGTPDQWLYVHPDHSAVLLMTNATLPDHVAIGIVDNAETWHSDGAHKAAPYDAIILHAVENPAGGGGETEFCDLRLAFDALQPDAQAALTRLTAVHHWSKALNRRFAHVLDDAAREEGLRIAALVPAMRQPLVCRHADSGRAFLYLSPRFTLHIEGFAPDISCALLDEIFAHLENPRFCYRHEWQENDLMIWDNHCLNHRVRAYAAESTRHRLRVAVSGRPMIRA